MTDYRDEAYSVIEEVGVAELAGRRGRVAPQLGGDLHLRLLDHCTSVGLDSGPLRSAAESTTHADTTRLPMIVSMMFRMRR
jgi:hypothetical protein